MSSRFKAVWEVIKFVAITIAIVVPIRAYVAQPFIVSGTSMYPTFFDREYLIIDELSYHLRNPKRGEVIVFRYPNDPSKHFIKRVIGLPSETVIIKDNAVFIASASGKPIKIDEPYAPNYPLQDLEVTLGPNDYFVMGDNRPVSLDSRSWGSLEKQLITGRVLIRLFPFDRVKILPGLTNN